LVCPALFNFRPTEEEDEQSNFCGWGKITLEEKKEKKRKEKKLWRDSVDKCLTVRWGIRSRAHKGSR